MFDSHGISFCISAVSQLCLICYQSGTGGFIAPLINNISFPNLPIGVLADNAVGDYASDVVYEDTNLAEFESSPATQARRPVDHIIVEADTQGSSHKPNRAFVC